MSSVVQNPLPDDDVACVAFVIAAGVKIAIVFRERSGGDGDAQTMSGRNRPRREPQIDVVLVSLAWLEELGTIEAVAETRSHDAILNALCPTVRIDMLLRLLQNVSSLRRSGMFIAPRR